MQTNFGHEPMRLRRVGMPRGRKYSKQFDHEESIRIQSDNPYVTREVICEAQKPRKRFDWREFWEMFAGGAGLALGVFSMMVILYYLFSGVIR